MNVLILDAYNLMHRARSGYRRGEFPVVYNFFRSLRPIVDKFKPEVCYFVLEGMPKKNIELLPEYKGNRKIDQKAEPKKYNEYLKFKRQRNLIIDYVNDYLPLVVAHHPDFEADDVMAELAHRHEGDNVTIVSGDSDMIQVLQETSWVSLWHPIKKEFLEAPEYNYVSWKALCGDATDNIPGLYRVGPKTAEKLLANPDKMAERWVDNPEDEAVYERNLMLVQLQRLGDAYSRLTLTQPKADFDSLREKFTELAFSSITKDKSWAKYVKSFSTLATS